MQQETEENNSQNHNDSPALNDGQNVYELGAHIAPTLSAESLSAEWTTIKGFIESKGGTFISEGFPQPFKLAFQIAKEEKGAYRKFNDSYFGWVKFVVDADKIAEIDTEVKAQSEVLRHLIVKTVKENTMYGDLDAPKKEEGMSKAATHAVTPEAVAATTDAAPAGESAAA